MLYKLVDGTECEYCAEPMFKDSEKNFDRAPLEADHSEGNKRKLADRLIHRECNRTINMRWQKHGPGWFAKHGNQTEDINYPGGSATRWPSFD